IVYGLIVGGMSLLFLRLPGGFLPDEDQGVLFSQVALPAGTTMADTERVMTAVRKHYMETEKENVENVFTIAGFSFAGQGQNVGNVFVRLRPWDERTGDDQTPTAIAQRANMHFAQYNVGQVIAFAPPAVMELGNASGFV